MDKITLRIREARGFLLRRARWKDVGDRRNGKRIPEVALEEYVPGRVGGRYDDMFNRDGVNGGSSTGESSNSSIENAVTLGSVVTFLNLD